MGEERTWWNEGKKYVSCINRPIGKGAPHMTWTITFCLGQALAKCKDTLVRVGCVNASHLARWLPTWPEQSHFAWGSLSQKGILIFFGARFSVQAADAMRQGLTHLTWDSIFEGCPITISTIHFCEVYPFAKDKRESFQISKVPSF